MALNVHSIETFGTNDGPGIRLVVFTQGCLMRCSYCQNPDTQAIKSSESKYYEVEEIISLLEKEKPYFKSTGGLTISGGEPTVQAHELIPLFEAARGLGFHICLDTCGAIYSPRVNQVYDLTDIVILDVKHIDPQKHKILTRHTNENALKNAEYRELSGKALWLRYVLVPGYSDDPQDLHRWAEHFKGFTSLKRVEVVPYHTLGVHKYAELGRTYDLAEVPPATKEQAEEAKAIFDQYLANVIVV